MIRSPCTGVCKIRDGICVGCRRTLAQIEAWSRLTDAERQAVLRAAGS